MEDASQISEKVLRKFGDFSDLHARIDEDFKLWKLDSSGKGDYEFLTKTQIDEDATEIKITSNDPRNDADNIQSALSASDRQIIVRMAEVEGEDKRDEIAKLERLFAFAFEQADIGLALQQLPPLKESAIWYSITTGRVAARILVYKSGKDVIFDFMPLDPRWLVYESGSRGLLWTGYQTFRSSADLRDEYDFKSAGDRLDNSVVDYWEYEGSKVYNAVICEKQFLLESQGYDLKRIPLVITIVATRPPVIRSGGDESRGYGESWIAPNREIIQLQNELVSLWASHANRLAEQGIINYYDEKGKPLKTTSNVPGGVLNLPMDHNKLEGTPMQQISPTLVNLVQWVDAKRQHGGLPDIEFGELLKFPLSGTAMNELKQARSKILGPHLRNVNYFYSDACRLIEEQLLAGKITVKVKTEREKKLLEVPVTPVDLKQSHTIKVEFTASTPWTQLDTYQIADMAKALGLPDAFIDEYILKLPDPKGTRDLKAIELFENSPKGAMITAMKALAKLGRGDEIMQLVQDLYNMTMREEMEVAGGQQPVQFPKTATPPGGVPPPAPA